MLDEQLVASDVYSAKLHSARLAAAELAAGHPEAAIYVSGSLLAGLGNATSDIDLFVVQSETVEDDRPHQRQVAGNRIDIEYLSVARFAAAMDRVEGAGLARRELKHLWPLLGDLDLLVRLRCAEVLTPTAALDRLLQRLAGLEVRLRRVLLARWAAEANNYLEDFFGAVLDGDDATAAWLSRDLMTAGGKALCAASGDLYVGHKWVYRQLRRSMPDSFPHDTFRWYLTGSWSLEPEGLVGMLGFLQTMLGVSQVLGWDGLGVDSWTNWLPGPQGYRRHPAFIPIHTENSILLNYEYRRQIELSPRAALVWVLAMGLTEADLLAQVQRLQAAGLPAAEGLTAQALNGLGDSLQRKQILGSTGYRLSSDRTAAVFEGGCES